MGSADALAGIRGRRYSDKRWRTQAKKICRRLKEYDYIDVKNELLARARVKKRTGKRPTVGCYMPTDRQLQREIKAAPWSEVISENDGHHHLTRYRFKENKTDEDGLSAINNTSEGERKNGC